MTSILSILIALTLALALTAHSARAVINCNTTVDLSTSQTLAEDYEKTTQTVDPCIRLIGATSQVVNMGGRKVTCNSNTGRCGRAIQIQGGGTIKNGDVEAGSGQWDTGVSCFADFSGLYIDCEVSDMYIEATLSAIEGGKKIDKTVVLGADICIDSIKTLTSGGFYRDNYCSADSAGTGFRFKGPSSGTFTVEENFIRAATGTGVEVQSGNVTLEHNVIDAATPFDDSAGGTVTLSENICSDSNDCPDPTVRGFSLTVNFN